MDWTKVLEKIEAASRELRILPENEKNEFLKKEEKGLSQNNEADFQENVELNQAEHMLLICREQVTQKGEDFYLMQKDGSQLLMGVFDGCGGSGAKVYSQFGNQTGARVASRTLAKAVKEWFEVQKISQHPEEKREEQESNPEEVLHRIMKEKLTVCQAAVQTGQLLLGSLKKEFPSTMVLFRVPEEQTIDADFFWCGDSRGYVMDAVGLHQVTEDDVAVTDAMENLREDAPMTNVANASVPFVIHRKRIDLEEKALILAATDGCFGYLPSPMEFEKLLLRTMAVSEDMKQWKAELEKAIGKVAGDDFTIAIWNGMFESFRQMKDSFCQRLTHMEEQYPLDEKTTDEILSAQWKEYKTSYESLLDAGEVKHGN